MKTTVALVGQRRCRKPIAIRSAAPSPPAHGRRPHNTRSYHLQSVCSALTATRALRVLSFDGAALGDAGVVAISRVLAHFPALRELAVRSAGIGPAGAKALADRLDRSALEALHVDGNPKIG